MMRLLLAALAFAAALLAPHAAPAQSILDQCAAETCKARLTPEQLLGEAQALIAAQRFQEAAPMLEALKQVPQLAFQTRYLSGQLAAATGDHEGAAAYYRAILSDDPGQTRVRLELAREMLAMGKPQSADRQFRMAEGDPDLPSDVARTIRTVRDIIRANRAWRLDFDFGIVPDSNINNATAADQITVLLWGAVPLPLTLDQQAQAKAGVGQTASLSGWARVPMMDDASLLVDVDTAGTNFQGGSYDDYQAQVAAGPEIRLGYDASVSAQAVGAQRWYGGKLVSRQAGVKAAAQVALSRRDRIGVQIDARRTDARFDAAYDGWQMAGYASYEHAVAPALVASAGVFARRDALKADAYSSTEYGATLGVGGELPLGVNFGVSGSVSKAVFDAPMPLFSLDPRDDKRFTARATLGNRKLAVWGFSPQVSVSFTRIDSSVEYYKTDRTRFRFALTRYF